jgi:hypothetical protein
MLFFRLIDQIIALQFQKLQFNIVKLINLFINTISYTNMKT